jgi:cytochrome c556
MKCGLSALVLWSLLAASAAFADTDPESPEAIDPMAVIAARQGLMVAIESLMRPIDTYTVDESVDSDLMRGNAEAIAAMLLAVPHLFPSDSNLFDADDDAPVTLALPAVWQSFASFYALAGAASSAATALTEAPDGNPLAAASQGLRAACDACHAVYLLPYEEPSVTQEDLDFDFDSLFDKN